MNRNHATLLTRRLAPLFLFCGVGCASDPTSPAPAASTTLAAEPAPTTAAAVTASAAPTSTSAAGAPAREIAGAAHVLVAYKGADRAPKGISRSREDAKKRAEEAAKKIKEGLAFEAAVKEYSDDEGSISVNGAVGNFDRHAMAPTFSDATFAMQVGEISSVVETPRGFHVIKRTR